MNQQPSRGFTLLLSVASIVIVIWGMRQSAPLLVEVLLAIFIAIVCAPSLYWLQKKGLPTWLSMVVVILGMFSIAIGFIVLMGPSVTSFANDLPQYKKEVIQTYEGVGEWFDKLNIVERLEKATGKNINIQNSMGELLDVNKAFQFAQNVGTALGSALGGAFMIALTAIFILLEASGFPQKLTALSGTTAKQSEFIFHRILEDVRRYLVLKTLMCLLTGVLTGLFLYFLGLKYPFLWGALAFFLNYIPNIGSIIAAIPAVLLGLVDSGWVTAAWIVVGYVVINSLVGNFLEPKLFGKGLGLSTLVIFLGLIFWGAILGPVGMVLSAPLTMVVKIVAETQKETRWLAILLSSDASLHSESDLASQ